MCVARYTVLSTNKFLRHRSDVLVLLADDRSRYKTFTISSVSSYSTFVGKKKNMAACIETVFKQTFLQYQYSNIGPKRIREAITLRMFASKVILVAKNDKIL